MIQEKQPGLSAERPFVGLRPYGFSDHAYFFGREDQVYSLFRLLDRGRFIAVVGSSGSGKSSLVRAGLLPILEQESAGHGGRQWHWIEMRPGDAPLDNLAHEVAKLAHEQGPDADAMTEVRKGRIASALRRSSFGLGKVLSEIKALEGQTVMLVVDQFEELFRFAHAGADALDNAKWREEAVHFVQTLLEATRERAVAVHVLITMRSDFIGDCAQFYGLPEAVSATQFLVPSTTRDQREQIITAPVAKAGATIDPLLVEQLLNDVSDELDQLPVLQHCLMRLWEAARADAKNQRPHLTTAHYDGIGRAQGALSQHAEEIFAGLEARALAVEQMFRAIAEIDNDGRVIRRALPFHSLRAETGINDTDLRQVCDRFRADDCSFLVPPPSAVPRLEDNIPVDVGHEALLRRWPRIGARAGAGLDSAQQDGWLVEEDRDGRKYRALLALVEGRRGQGRVTLPVAQVEEWMAWWNERPRTEAWADRYGGNFARIQRLLSDSVAALAEENARAARQKKFDRFFRVAAAGALVLILGLAVEAVRQWQRAAELEAVSTQQGQMMVSQMTRVLYSAFENFRLIPHSQNAVSGLVQSTQDFEKQYRRWAGTHSGKHNVSTSLDRTLKIIKADLYLMPGLPSRSVRELDEIEPQLASIPDADPSKLLILAEFHFHRGTAERYDDLFDRARDDYNKCIELARRIIAGDKAGETDFAVVAEAKALLARSLRIRVEVDTSAHIVTRADSDLRNAVADNAAYSEVFKGVTGIKASRAGCGDLSNIGTNLSEKWIHNGLMEIEQGRYAQAVTDYARYVEMMNLQKNCNTGDQMFSNLVLATGRVGYAKALMGAGQLDAAAAQLDMADDYYETELKPGDKQNAFALHSDDQLHLTRGELALKRKNPSQARAAFQAALSAASQLTARDPDNAREWDDTYLARDGMARAAALEGDKALMAQEQQLAAQALARANRQRAEGEKRRVLAAKPI
ncbi:MAG: hypothetical protein JF627_09320 [Alphaproteobacteria bacterium]|nr:hypothetical protein [Alphaproteobacteria bacterium]